MSGPSGPILSVPSSLSDELYKDLAETGMLQFAQHTGVLPELRGEQWAGTSNDPSSSEAVRQHMNGDMNGVDLVAGSQQAASMAAPQQVMASSMPPEACGISGLVVTESELAHATEATRAADSAVAEALAVLSKTRHEMQALTGLGPSSSNMSDGQAMDFPDMAGQAGHEDEGTSSGRRRGRPSTRPDQHHAALAAAAAAATAAAAAAAAGGHGSGGVTGKAGKGLRHFSMKVCEKVESKGTTSYNEVADELVAEMRGVTEDGTTYDEKNIRRRVYDAINVLMALDIIAKEKKAILWKGFPSNRGGGLGGINATQRLASEKAALTATVERKAEMLGQLIEQQRALKHLLQRNSSPAGVAASAGGTALQLPFILVQAKPDATVEVHISQDMRDVQFDFYNSPFQMYDDHYVLRMMATNDAEQADQAAAGAAGRPAAAAPGEPGGAGPSNAAAAAPTAPAAAPAAAAAAPTGAAAGAAY